MSLNPGDISSQLLQSIRPKQIEYASQYDLREMVLTLSGGTQSMDIRNLVIEWNWYEDMLGTCVSGNATLYDTLNLLGNAALSGNETLRIVVDTPTKNKPLQMDFAIYNVSPIMSNPEQNTKRGQIYTINFCSIEKLSDTVLLVQKSYKGTLVSDIVKDLLGPSYINTSKNIYTEPTVGPQDIIIPAFRPLKAVDWLTTQAVSNSQNPAYVFFENRYGFYFVSLETLCTDAPSDVPEYILTPKGVEAPDNVFGVPDISRRMKSIKDYQFIGTPDTLHQTKEGVFGSVLYTYDPVRMKFSEIVYSIVDGFQKFKGPNPGSIPYVPHSNLARFPHAKRYMAQTNYNISQTPYGASHDPTINNTLVESYAGKRESLLSAAETFKIRMLVNGDVGLTVGTVIDIKYPALDRRDIRDINKLDTVYSGRYLITALRHQFKINTHHTILEAVKGTVNTGMGRV